MKQITEKNSIKFDNAIEKKLINTGFKKTNDIFTMENISARIDTFETSVYSVFLRFTNDIPKIADNQFSGKHNFHFSGSLKNALIQFDLYFVDIENHLKNAALEKFEIKTMVEIENFIETISKNTGLSENEIETFLFSACRYPEGKPVFFWNEPKYFDDDDKHPVMVAIYKTMEKQGLNGIYVSESI